jgi:anti-anti-sigma regulatory factor
MFTSGLSSTLKQKMGKRKESGTEEEVIIGIRDLNYIDSI